jgi:hypothetical protein
MQSSKWIAAAATYCFAVGAVAAVSLVRTLLAVSNTPVPLLVAQILGAGLSLAWVVPTGIGLLRRRAWARSSILVLAAFGVLGGLAGLVMSGTADLTARISSAVNLSVGIALLVVFNLRGIRAAFPSGR